MKNLISIFLLGVFKAVADIFFFPELNFPDVNLPGSVGVSLQYELATGRFPYPKWNSVFDQLTQVVKGDPPQLSNSEEREFSPSFINFVNLW